MPANDQRFQRNLEVAVWKMRRVGVPSEVILSTLRITAGDFQRMTREHHPPSHPAPVSGGRRLDVHRRPEPRLVTTRATHSES